jgi:hypothetical protein
VRNKKDTFYCYSDEERQRAIHICGKNAEITRFKGLGEISPDEFKHFIGEDIRLEPVMITKDAVVNELLGFYMGKNTPQREQDFIIENLKVEKDVIGGSGSCFPAAGTVASGIWALAARKKHNDAYDEYIALRDSYGTLNAPEAITNVKEDALPRAAEEVDRTRRQLILALSVGTASALATVYGFLRKGRTVAPFHDQEKVKFDGLVWLPDTDGGSLHMGLTWMIR